MKRILISILLMAVMLAGMMNVHAAEAQITVEVRASKSEVQVGDTVEYTVLATGSGVVAMQFELRFPAGLSYVPNSGATPENLAQKLGAPSADWTETSKMFTFYNDIGITFAKGTEICRFSCVAEQEGEWAPELYELLPFNEDFEEFSPSLQVQQIVVTGPGELTAPTAPEEPTVPVEPELQTPALPSEPQSTNPVNTEKPAAPETVPEMQDGENPEPTVPAHTGDHSGDMPQDLPEDTLTIGPQLPTMPDQDLQNQEKPAKTVLLWLFPLIVAVVIGGSAAIFILIKKKAA